MRGFLTGVVLLIPLALLAATPPGGALVEKGKPHMKKLTVKVLPDPGKVGIKETLQFKAEITDASGNPVADAKVKWVVMPHRLGTITDDGLFTPTHKGTGTIHVFVESSVGVGKGVAHVRIIPEKPDTTRTK